MGRALEGAPSPFQASKWASEHLNQGGSCLRSHLPVWIGATEPTVTVWGPAGSAFALTQPQRQALAPDTIPFMAFVLHRLCSFVGESLRSSGEHFLQSVGGKSKMTFGF